MKNRQRPVTGALLTIVAGSSLGLVLLGAIPIGTDAAQTPRRAIVKLRAPLAQQLESALPSSLQLTSKSVAPAGARDFVLRHSVRRLFPLHPPLVEAKRRLGLSDRELALRVRERFGTRAARRRTTFNPPELTRTYVLEVDPAAGGTLEDVLARLRSDPDVEYAEEDKVVKVSLTPDDPYYSSSGSWGQSYDDLYGLKKIRAGAAWDLTTGEGVTVAVVDTGIDYTHPDIAGNVWVNTDEIPGNGVDDDGNGFVDDALGWDFIGTSYFTPTPDADPRDDHGHGTHVAGTVAAQGNNGLGVIGVAWRSKVMAVKGLDRSGSGLNSTLSNAILYAANNGADVINNSWGGKGTSQAVRDALDYAYNLGVVSVCAAGNSNADVLDYYPASFPNVITVAATDAYDGKAYYSNWGSRIDVAAPGSDILSLRAAGTSMGQALDAYYTRADGTSMASPHVAGLAALVLSLHPSWSVEEVRQAIRASATDKGFTGIDGDYGYGRVDAGAAVALAGVLEARIKSPADGTRVTGLVTLSGLARGNGFVRYRLERGSGPFPTSWSLLQESTSPVSGGTLGALDTSTLVDGIYTVRLTAYDASSRAFVDQVQLVVDYVKIASPVPPRVPNLASVFKPGVAIAIQGTATGPSFHSFRVEWARGLDPADGWSAAGMSLAGGGTAPIANGALATWNTASIVQADYYTLRLVVDNTGFTSESRTVVYLEPDLLSANWPKWLPEAPGDGSGVVPATDAAGNFRLSVVVPNYLSANIPPRLYTFSPDGATQSSTDLYYGAFPQPAAANFDGSPGEETIVAEANSLRVFRSDGSSYVLSPSRLVNFQFSLVQPVDLDGDGKLEVLAWGTDWKTKIAYLFAWRPDGQQLNANFPIAVLDNNFSVGDLRSPRTLVADLDGDGRKEIFFVEGGTSTTFTIRAYNGDGTPRTSWPSPTFDGAPVAMVLADLDKDGTPDLVFVAGAVANPVLHVLGADGAERPGWPFSLHSYGNSVAIGDLDQDGRDEIVVSDGGRIYALRGDGSPLSTAWPRLSDFLYPDFHLFGPVVVADVTGDGVPEIVVAVEDLVGTPYPQPAGTDAEQASSLESAAMAPAVRERRIGRDGSATERTVMDRPGAAAYPGLVWSDIRLLAIDAGAQDVRSWRLLGGNGNQPFRDVKATVGDFDRDGSLDIAVTYRNIKGGDVQGLIGEGEVTVLKAGVPYTAGASGWPSIFHDSRNTASLLRTDLLPPSVSVTAPAAGAVVTGPVTVAAQATDDAGVTAVQFKLDGADLGPEDTGPPFTTEWDARLSTEGPHTLSAVARDAAGRRTTSAPVGVTVVHDAVPPVVSITSPTPGSAVAGIVTVTTQASDDRGVAKVELWVDDTRLAVGTAAPFSFAWDTTVDAPGSHTLVARAYDGALNLATSDPVTVTVLASLAAYDPGSKAPRCPLVTNVCDSGMLLNGRGGLGPEPNAPNTIGGSCADGTYGAYHVDESNDRIRITSVDGLSLAPGKLAQVEATIWASNFFFKSNRLNLYYAANAANPAWTQFATFSTDRPGAKLYSATFTIPPGKLAAVRAQLVSAGSSGPCVSTNYGDHDDLIFPLANLAPVANAGGPYTGVRGQAIAFDGRASKDGNGDSLTYHWNFGDGSTGTGATPTHAFSALGTYTVSLVVDDGQANSEPATAVVTITTGPPTARPGGPYGGAPGQVITFDGSTSSDPDGDPLTYRWDFGDGTTATGVMPTHAFAQLGNYTISLVVNDGTLDSPPATTIARISDTVVVNLDASASAHRTAHLTWTAVPTSSQPTAAQYDVRYAKTPITEATFATAFQAQGEPAPKPAGSAESFDVTGLNPRTTYYFALKVLDSAGNASPLSNVASTTTTEALVFLDEVEQGSANWVAEGSDGVGGPALWHVATHRYFSPTHAFYYGIDSKKTYNTGVRNAGTLTSGPISLEGATGSYLAFRSFLQKESSASFDQAKVFISSNGGAWLQINLLSASSTLAPVELPLSAYDGQTIRIRFGFDTIDSFFNDYEGWVLDDVVVGAASRNRTPTASAGGPYSGVRDQALSFDGSGSSDPDGKSLTYQWDFGDGATGSGPTPTHAYTALGSYTVTLVVNNGFFNSAPATANVTIENRAPVAAAGGPYTGVRNQAVTFTGTGSSDPDGDPLTYQWDFGDGTTGSGPTPAHAYTALGSFTATLVVNDGAANSAPATANVTIENRLPVAVAGGPYTAVRNQAITFTGTGSSDPDADPLTYQWDFGDGTTGSGPTPTHAYAALGSYTATLVVNDGTANSTPATATVTINNLPPTASVTSPPNGTVVTAPAQVVLLADAADPDGRIALVEFFAGATKIGESAAPPYTVTWGASVPGAYALTARATDESGASTTSAPVSVLVNAPPSATLTSPVPGAVFAAPASITLTATASDPDGQIVRVEFYGGTTLLGSVPTAPYTWTWTNAPAGAHSLTARAVDDRGAAASSPAVAVSVESHTAPVADAYVRDGSSNAGKNFGTATTLTVRKGSSGSNRWSYLKFDTSVLTTVSRVRLRLFGSLSATTSTAVTTSVYAVANTTWGEAQITWNNKPASGATSLAGVAMANRTTTARWYEWDVTAYLQQEKAAGRHVVTLVLKNDANSSPNDSFHSREATSQRPELVLTP